MREPVLDPGEAELRDQAAEPAFRIRLAFNRDGAAQHLQRVDVGLAAYEPHGIGKTPADLIAPDEMSEGQRVGAYWCLDDCGTIAWHGSPVSPGTRRTFTRRP